MWPLHPVTLGAGALWTSAVCLALLARDLSAAAGRLPDGWTGVGMVFGFLHLVVVVAGCWFLPDRLPRIVTRLIQLAGMAGAFWSSGTLTRALYALTT